MKEQTIFKIL